MSRYDEFEVDIQDNTNEIEIDVRNGVSEFEIGLETVIKEVKVNLTEEKDPTVPVHVKSITEEDINRWNNKSNFSGSYNDLLDRPEETDPTMISITNREIENILAKWEE